MTAKAFSILFTEPLVTVKNPVLCVMIAIIEAGLVVFLISVLIKGIGDI